MSRSTTDPRMTSTVFTERSMTPRGLRVLPAASAAHETRRRCGARDPLLAAADGLGEPRTNASRRLTARVTATMTATMTCLPLTTGGRPDTSAADGRSGAAATPAHVGRRFVGGRSEDSLAGAEMNDHLVMVGRLCSAASAPTAVSTARCTV